LEQRIARRQGRGRSSAPVLADFLRVLYHAADDDFGAAARPARDLLRALPENAIVAAELGFLAVRAKEDHTTSTLPVPDVSRQLRRFPNCYLFRLAEAGFHTQAGRPDAARTAAEAAVRAAPRNPDAWRFLSGRIFEQANAIRHARFIREMTKGELAYCRQKYEEELIVLFKAVQLDGRYFRSWRNLSSAAAFAGDGKLADYSFSKAFSLAPWDVTTHEWGLQLYQPKWYGDRAKLLQVARSAASVGTTWPPQKRLQVAFDAHCAGLPELAQSIVRTDEERAALKEGIERHLKEHQGGT
jgi:tetratricopeptide (TPR) repeat protein